MGLVGKRGFLGSGGGFRGCFFLNFGNLWNFGVFEGTVDLWWWMVVLRCS